MFLTAATAGTPPERDKGISMHLLPKTVAEISVEKVGAGLWPQPGSTADARRVLIFGS